MSDQKIETTWLSKNIQPILALSIVGLTFALYYIIILRPSYIERLGSKELVFTIVGALSTVSTQVVGYFFGSSQSSKEKQDTIYKMGQK
jgi:hypothetical protein